MKSFKLFFLFLILLIFSSVLVIGVKPITDVFFFDEGYSLEYVRLDTVKVNQSYDVNIVVFNNSNGVPIVSGIGCYYQLYNTSGSNIVTISQYTLEDLNYGFYIDGANFSTPGEFSYIIQCNSTNAGGLLGGNIYVTFSGYQGETNVAIKTGLTVLGFIFTIFLIIFTFIYIGKSIEVIDWSSLALKVLFYCFALGMTFLPLAFINTMITYARNTIPNTDIADGLGTATINLWNTSFGVLRIAIITLAVFSLIYLIYLIYMSLLDVACKKNKGFKEEY